MKHLKQSYNYYFPISLSAILIFMLSFGTHIELNELEKTPYRFYNLDWSDSVAQFKNIENPVSYHIQISKNAGFTEIIDQDSTYVSRYVCEKPFDIGEYYWRVKEINSQNSKWANTKSFSVIPYDLEITIEPSEDRISTLNTIQGAIYKVKKNVALGKSVKLIFKKGAYYLPENFEETLINIEKIKNIEIDGQGSVIHFSNRKQGLIKAINCENVSIQGFSVDFKKNIFRSKGKVLAIDKLKKIASIKLETNSPVLEESSNIKHDVFLLLDSEIDARQKTGASSYYRMEKVLQKKGNTYKLKMKAINDWEKGDRFVFHFRSGSNHFVDFSGSKNVTAYNLTTNGWGGMGFVSKKGSNFNILSCKTNLKSGNWMMGNADGIHIREHTIGPWIENTRIFGTGDDGMALYARPSKIISADRNEKKALFCGGEFFNLEKGDEVSFFEPISGRILQENVVQNIEKTAGKNKILFKDEIVKEIFDITEGKIQINSTIKHKANNNKLQDILQIWNRSKSCGEFVVTNSEFICNRRFANVFRSKGGVLENNLYQSASSSAIRFFNETAWPNGLYASEIIIKDNRIIDSGFLGDFSPAINFSFTKRGNGPAESNGPKNILVENNYFFDCPADSPIRFKACEKTILKNNYNNNIKLK